MIVTGLEIVPVALLQQSPYQSFQCMKVKNNKSSLCKLDPG